MIRTLEEISEWERNNSNSIFGWTIEYDTKPVYKVITFTMIDKSKVKFEINIDHE
jgi:hypothetical protein